MATMPMWPWHSEVRSLRHKQRTSLQGPESCPGVIEHIPALATLDSQRASSQGASSIFYERMMQAFVQHTRPFIKRCVPLGVWRIPPPPPPGLLWLLMDSLIAAASLLKKREAELPGTVVILFQPAEEGGAGAKMMINEGAVDDVSAAFAIHVWPYIQSGHLLSKVCLDTSSGPGSNTPLPSVGLTLKGPPESGPTDGVPHASPLNAGGDTAVCDGQVCGEGEGEGRARRHAFRHERRDRRRLHGRGRSAAPGVPGD